MNAGDLWRVEVVPVGSMPKPRAGFVVVMFGGPITAAALAKIAPPPD